MNLEEEENNKKLNLLTPLINILNSILSLKQENIFKKGNNSSNDNLSNYNILESFNDDIKYCFKVLILDDCTFKFISPLLKQSSLKRNNICLTSKLNCQKDKMDDVMAIYLITPTSSNFELLLNDMKSNIYQNYSINFVEKPDDNLIVDFLSKIIEIGKYKKIYNLHVFPIKYSLIHPKVIDFCSLDNKIVKPYSLFNLNQNNKVKENYYDLISNMLFNCLFCMKISPLIKYRKGSFCELIVNKIQNKFTSVFNKFPKLQEEFRNGDCLLILLERDLLDIPLMLHHPSSFGAIINDICGLTFDQPVISLSNNNDIRKFNLDPLNDFIWNKSIIKQFHEVGQETLLKYKKYNQENEILQEDNKKQNYLEELENRAEKLAESIKSIDIKKIQGDIFDKHAKFYPILNKNIEQRHLAEIFSIEKGILDKREISKEINDNITSMINENKINKDNNLDIFRLCLIYLLNDKNSSNDKFIKDIIDKLNLPHPYDSKAIVDFLTLKKNGEVKHSSKDLINKYEEEKKPKTLINKMGGYAGGFLKKGFNLIVNTVTNFTYSIRPSIAMEIIYDLYYNRNRDTTEFLKFQLNEDIYTPIKSSCYQNIFLFTFGGGSLNEFEYCKEYMDKLRVNFIYGADKIYSPNEFLSEINEIAICNMTTKKT